MYTNIHVCTLLQDRPSDPEGQFVKGGELHSPDFDSLQQWALRTLKHDQSRALETIQRAQQRLVILKERIAKVESWEKPT